MKTMLPDSVVKWIIEVLKLKEFRLAELKRHGSHALKGKYSIIIVYVSVSYSYVLKGVQGQNTIGWPNQPVILV